MREQVKNFLHTHVRPDSTLVAMEEWIYETYDIPADVIEGVFYQDTTSYPHTNMYELRLREEIEVDTVRKIAKQREDITYKTRTADGDQWIQMMDVLFVDGEKRGATAKASFDDGCDAVGISFISESEPFEVDSTVDDTLEALQIYFQDREPVSN